MKKGYVVATMLAVVFLGAIYVVISLLGKNEAVVYNKNYTWHAELDPSGGAESAASLVRGSRLDEIRGDVNKLVLALNRVMETTGAARPGTDAVRTDFPRLVLEKVEKDTADVRVVNDQYLTEAMGSSGAQDYLAEATYTLTENRGIKAVNFIFSPGDHAMPGLYSRESFTGYRLVVDRTGRR